MAPPRHVASFWPSARYSLDLAISVWGLGEKKKKAKKAQAKAPGNRRHQNRELMLINS